MTGRQGYSVFEVLIAFAIMALVLSALLPGQARLLTRASRGGDAVLAYDFARSRLAVLATEQPLEAGETVLEDGDWRAIQTVGFGESSSGAQSVEIMVTVVDAAGREMATASDQRHIPNE